MQTLDWLESHLGSLEEVVEVLNRDFCWFLSVDEGKNGKWFVRGGEKVIFSADSREAVDAFLYGMGLSIMSIPEEIFDQLSHQMKRLCDDVTGR
jgi:hypothetical protein